MKAIHDTLKDMYAYLSGLCEEPGLDVEIYGIKTEVFLVGLQREEKNWSSFAGQLRRMLKTRSYIRLIVPPEGGDPYWTNLGAELSIHDNSTLLCKIQCYSCWPPQLIRQSLACHCELFQRFKDDPFVLYEKVEDKGGGVSSISESYNLEQCLDVLHCFGFIFYCSLPDLEIRKGCCTAASEAASALCTSTGIEQGEDVDHHCRSIKKSRDAHS